MSINTTLNTNFFNCKILILVINLKKLTLGLLGLTVHENKNKKMLLQIT